MPRYTDNEKETIMKALFCYKAKTLGRKMKWDSELHRRMAIVGDIWRIIDKLDRVVETIPIGKRLYCHASVVTREITLQNRALDSLRREVAHRKR